MRKNRLILLAACAAFNSTAWALQPGDPLIPDALGKADVIQGEVPKAWEPGKVYILECWATWCAPCVAAIPHADELYDQYKDKGLVVVGVDVWEDAKDKVTAFVRKKGDGMSYPVICTGNHGSAFDTGWLKPAGVSGIPYAFVVKDGKFLFGTHPGKLTADAIEGLLAGGEKQGAVINFYRNLGKPPASSPLVNGFQMAQSAKDPDKMAENLAALEKLDPKHSALPGFRIQMSLAKKDWPALEQSIQAFPPDEKETGSLINCCAMLDNEADVPERTLKACVDKLSRCPCNARSRFSEEAMMHVVISRFQWRTGDKDAAKASAKTAVEKAKAGFEDVFKAYATSLEADKPQTSMAVSSACFDVVFHKKN